MRYLMNETDGRVLGDLPTSLTSYLAKRFAVVVFLLALALRIGAMYATHAYRITNLLDHFSFGWEMGRVGRSLAEGRGFSSPMPAPTGPTAIVGPIYPLLIALVFKCFGVYSKASALVILLVQCVFSSATCVFIYLFSRSTVGETAAKLASLGWAVFPLSILLALRRIWETSLSAALVGALFLCFLSLRDSFSALRWASAGVLLAMSALVNASLVVLAIPFLVSFGWKYRTKILPVSLAAGLSFAVVLSPWIIRNYIQFGGLMLRSNFPMEFRLGNNEWSLGQKVDAIHPSEAPALNDRWRDLGENRFMAEERALNRKFLETHRGLFVFATLNRTLNYWTGAWLVPTDAYPNRWPVIVLVSGLSIVGLLGVRRMFFMGNDSALLYIGCFLLYPLPYYMTTSQPRFYLNLAVLLISCAAFYVVDLKHRIRRRMESNDSSPTRPVHAF